MTHEKLQKLIPELKRLESNYTIEEFTSNEDASVACWFKDKVFMNIKDIVNILDNHNVSGLLARNRYGYMYIFIN